jgi:transposase
MRPLAARGVAVIRIDAVWMAIRPLDMRAGMDTALARVITVFGAAQPHHAYAFANRRTNRIKVLIHDGIGIWLVSRRLHQGRFAWSLGPESTMQLSQIQFDALVVGLPWHRLGEAGVITVV